MMADDNDKSDKYDSDSSKPDKMFTLKKWNSVAMWSWDVECEICAICRVQVMDACLRCQAESKKDIQSKDGACVVGECLWLFIVENISNLIKILFSLGRMQSQLPSLLHVIVGQAEQSMSSLPARMVNPAIVELNIV